MPTEIAFLPVTGRCRCENARFRLEAEPIITHACHCRLCQRSSGSAFGTVSMIESHFVRLIAGKTQASQGAKSHKQIQCAECGCTLWVHRPDLGDGIALVRVGMLDEPERLPPEAHYYVRSKHPWITLPPGVPAFADIGDPGKPGVRERIMAMIAHGGSLPAAG